MSILVIDNYDSFTFNLVDLLKRASTKTVEVYRNNRIELSEVKRFRQIVFSPGPGLPSEAGRMLEIIKAYASSKPMLGICLGHQAIAEAFGGTLIPAQKPIHGKSSTITLHPALDTIFANLPKEITVGRYHSWVVDRTSLPSCIRVSAEDSCAQVMALKHCDLPLYGLQFHPESILTPDGRELIYRWISITEEK